MKKLIESLPLYQDKLFDKEIFKHFIDIISKVGFSFFLFFFFD